MLSCPALYWTFSETNEDLRSCRLKTQFECRATFTFSLPDLYARMPRHNVSPYYSCDNVPTQTRTSRPERTVPNVTKRLRFSTIFTHVTGHFSQMVWRSSSEFGVGKARTRCGKIIVVGMYKPAGNVLGEFHRNVLPRPMPPEDEDMSPEISDIGTTSSST